MNDIGVAISESAYDFEHTVWPVISPQLGGGKIIPVETVTDTQFAKELDTLAGVDAWHIMANGIGMAGIASRVQWRFKNKNYDRSAFTGNGWSTFTIRWETRYHSNTEIHKRSYAIAEGHGDVLYPSWTVQAYMEEPEGQFLSCAIIKTRELISTAMNSGNDFPLIPAPGGNKFKAFPWKWLDSRAPSLVVFDKDTVNQPDLFTEESP